MKSSVGHGQYRVRSGISVKFDTAARVTLSYNEKMFQGNKFTLKILDAFANTATFKQAFDTVWKNGFGKRDFWHITTQIRELIQDKFILPPEEDELHLAAHQAHYESYTVHLHMLNDNARVKAYQKAIQRLTKPEDVVLEIGIGTGILSATAAIAGAKKVFAIEETRIVDVAQKVFEANGIADRVTIICGEATQVELPEKADILIAELIGNHALDEGVLRVTRDAVHRFLKPQAQLIPSRIRLFALPVSIPTHIVDEKVVTESVSARWEAQYGIDLSPFLASTKKSDQWFQIRPQKARHWPTLSAPILLDEIDLKNITSLDVRTQKLFSIEVTAELNGVLLYFALNFEGEWLSIAPADAARTNHWVCDVWVPASRIEVKSGEIYRIDYQFMELSRRSDIRIHRN
jgi:2-polyprenyl-3-methyl-5-hydroxy-6-metoxy-1,4-benzoquinol methylase